MRVIYLTSDLFFSSRITSLARDHGWQIELAGSTEKAVAAARGDSESVRLLLVDLANMQGDLAACITALRETHPGLHVVAYGPHVDEALLSSARTAGCDEVLTRGQFNQQAASIIATRLTPDRH